MSNVFNYMFDNMSRIGDDKATINDKEQQNVEHGNYTTNNHYLKYAGMREPINFATSQPNVFYKGGHGALNGSTIDNESDLLIGKIQTNPKCKLNLQQRQFLTVPYLGKGVQKPVLESKLQQGAVVDPKKSCKKITEKSYGRERTHLVESLQKTVQNPNNLVESSAHDGWIRGGLPSRQLAIETAMRNN